MRNLYWAAIHCAPGIGNRTLTRLLHKFDSGEAVWQATISELIASNCFRSAITAEAFIKYRDTVELADLARTLHKHEVSIITINDLGYPAGLKSIYDAPAILYYQGELPADSIYLSVVGSRLATAYGQRIASELAAHLAQHNVVVVSGAAKGIDTQAHLGALRYGKTIAVLGCGLDIAYPAVNRSLLERIRHQGAVISEYPLGTKPQSGNFPARNRIISGLSKGVIVVEAARNSGSLITAELALEEGRDVFAIPGNVFSDYSRGCHYLIQQGAKLIVNAEDILSEYQIRTAPGKDSITSQPQGISEEQQAVYNELSDSEAKSIDELVCRLRNKVSNLSFILLQMKLKGIILETSPNFYIRASRECV